MLYIRNTICKLCIHVYNIVEKGGLYMDSKSMMELTKELDAEFDNLVNNCMTSGAIDLNLY